MADYKDVRVERLFLKVPNTEKLRKGAAGRHKHLLADGWREVERRREIDHIWVRYERTGPTPLRLRMPRPEKDQSGATMGWPSWQARPPVTACGHRCS